VIDRRLLAAAAWSLAASALSLLGFLHSWRFVPNDAIGSMPLIDRLVGVPSASGTLFPAAPYAIGYAGLAVVLVLARHFTVPDEDGPTP
jgi:VIT1/CCC1 family predicted Fe2+/Mn2+ transporter